MTEGNGVYYVSINSVIVRETNIKEETSCYNYLKKAAACESKLSHAQ